MNEAEKEGTAMFSAHQIMHSELVEKNCNLAKLRPTRVLLRFFVWITAIQVKAVAFTTDGNRCLIGGYDKKAVIYDTGSVKPLITMKRDGAVRFFEFGSL